MRGGWMGSAGTVGGLTRTYGLGGHFEKAGYQGIRPRLTRDVLKRVACYLRPYWIQWIVVFVCVAATASLNVLPPYCVRYILDRAIPQADARLLALLAGAMVGLAMASGLIGVLQQSLTARIGQGILFDLRNQLYTHLQKMSLHFYTSTRSGEIVSRLNNDVNAVQHVATGTLVTIASNVMTLAATATALLSMNWRLALLAVLVVPAFYLPSQMVGRVRRRLSAQTQESQASLLAFMQERLHVGGALLMQIFGQAGADARTFRERSGQVRDLHVRQHVVGRWLFMVLSVFSAAGPALIYWYGGLQVIRQDLTVGQLVAFAALLTLLYRPLVQLATVYTDVQASVAVFERIFEYLDMHPDVKEAPEASVLRTTQGHVIFEDVCFAYPAPLRVPGANGEALPEAENGEAFALRNVSFEIASGQQVALVGPSGAGKTTITYLLPRFYDPSQGRILLDGHDLRDLDGGSLRRHIGMVTQETFLFHASIRENLLYARPDASHGELEAACRAANIHEFIAALPDGYDTVVGERGFRLSGGEKQRLSIARALLKDPAILILDEATSNLDATSEFMIQEAMEKLLRGRTSLIIAHRLSTILSSDKIVVLDRGQVVQAGRHEELIARGGLYAALFEQQFSKVLGGNGQRGVNG
jgi:ATP-binding cassette subfamily B protein